jgi:hypothetical protein
MAKRIVSAAAFFLAFAFIAVGYAALTDTMNISGTATIAPPPEGVYITNVEVERVSGGVTHSSCKYISPTNVNSVVNVTGNGSITYKITVENSTSVTTWYQGTKIVSDLAGTHNNLYNANGGLTIYTKDKLSDGNGSFNTDDWIPPKTTREFYAVYSFGSSVRGQGISTLINFSFGLKIESYGDDILAILNNKEKYDILVEAFNETYAKNGSTVLSNVGTDKALFESLFGVELKLDGKDVTIAIERKNVDGKSTGDSYASGGPTGCEYTIYVTTGDGTVHAVSYMLDSSINAWRQIGELYEGTAGMTAYKDSDGNSAGQTVNVDGWVANKNTYRVFSYGGRVVEYMVANQYGNHTQQWDQIGELMSEEDVNLYNSLDDHPIFKDTYKILQRNPDSSDREIELLREAYNNAIPKYVDEKNGGQEFKVNRNLYSRAEILAAMEALGKAMEYYDQVNGTKY